MISIILTTGWVVSAYYAYGLNFEEYRGHPWRHHYNDGYGHASSLIAAVLGPMFCVAMWLESGCRISNMKRYYDLNLAYGPWLADKIKRYKSRDRIKKLRECGWDV